jgi:hypothetical protein
MPCPKDNDWWPPGRTQAEEIFFVGLLRSATCDAEIERPVQFEKSCRLHRLNSPS